MSSAKENFDDEIFVGVFPVGRSPQIKSRNIIKREPIKIFDFPGIERQEIIVTAERVTVLVHVRTRPSAGARRILATTAPVTPAAESIDTIVDRISQIMLVTNWILSRPIGDFAKSFVIQEIRKIRAARAVAAFQEGVKAGEPGQLLASRARKATRRSKSAGRGAAKLAVKRTKAVARAKWLIPVAGVARFILFPVLVVATLIDIILIVNRAAEGLLRAEARGEPALAGFIGGGIAGVVDVVSLSLVPEARLGKIERGTSGFLAPFFEAFDRGLFAEADPKSFSLSII